MEKQGVKACILIFIFISSQHWPRALYIASAQQVNVDSVKSLMPWLLQSPFLFSCPQTPVARSGFPWSILFSSSLSTGSIPFLLPLSICCFPMSIVLLCSLSLWPLVYFVIFFPHSISVKFLFFSQQLKNKTSLWKVILCSVLETILCAHCWT